MPVILLNVTHNQLQSWPVFKADGQILKMSSAEILGLRFKSATMSTISAASLVVLALLIDQN